MKLCGSCEHENADDVDFCTNCGRYLRWEPTQLVPRVALGQSATAAGGPGDAVAAPPAPEPTPPRAEQPAGPQSAIVTLRGAQDPGDGPVSAEVEAGGHVALTGLVRNQSTIVDN